MSAPEPVADHPRRNGLLLAFAGGIVGAGALVLRAASRQRQQAAGTSGEATGRGEPGEPPSPQAAAKGFETEDMSGALMGALTLGLGLAIGISIWLMITLLHSFNARRAEAPSLTSQQRQAIAVPLPHLQAAPYVEIGNVRRHEFDRLARYGWADTGHLRARVPIGVAIGRTVGQSLDGAP